MFDILSVLAGKKKLTPSGWYTLNAVCCHHNGHSPDKRSRGGIKFEGSTNWTYNCFNCQYKCHFVLGRAISYNTRKLLSWCGIDHDQIQRWNLESLQKKDLLDLTTYIKKIKVSFEDRSLSSCEPLELSNPNHKQYIDYLHRRKMDSTDYSFYVSPNDVGRNSKRIIIPYFFKNKIVGHASRFIDDQLPKYIQDHQPGYVFGIDFQKSNWQSCIVTEGIFDALSINGCATMHNTISEGQVIMLNNLNRRIIVVPDQDAAGLEICDRAADLGYQISLPEWHDEVKDVNDAVIKYGKIPTLLSIISAATSSKVKVKLRRNQIAKRL
jgi:hypothetical protein